VNIHSNKKLPSIPITIPDRPNTLDSVLERIRHQPFYDNQFVGESIIPANPPTFGESTMSLPLEIQNAIEKGKGVKRLYTHQAESLSYVMSGYNVVVSTPTARFI